MRRADRLFDIIQTLRAAAGPLTAAAIAEKLEVTARTIYRDIAALQASRVPIEGAAGIGYVLRRGFDLPPLMFSSDEIDAIVVGARHVRRLRDPKLQQAAESVLDKVAAIVPESFQPYLRTALLRVGGQRAAADRHRSLGGSRRDPDDAQDVDRLRRWRRTAHGAHHLADRDGVLRGCNCGAN